MQEPTETKTDSPWRREGHETPDSYIDDARRQLNAREFTAAGWEAGNFEVVDGLLTDDRAGFLKAGLVVVSPEVFDGHDGEWFVVVERTGMEIARLPTALSARKFCGTIFAIVDLRWIDSEISPALQVQLTLALRSAIRDARDIHTRAVRRINSFDNQDKRRK